MSKAPKNTIHKKIDYFALLQGKKPQTNFFSAKTSSQVSEAVENSVKSIIETPAMKIRKAEINAVKVELERLRHMKTLEVQTKKSVPVTHMEMKRHAELLHTKQLLAEASKVKVY